MAIKVGGALIAARAAFKTAKIYGAKLGVTKSSLHRAAFRNFKPYRAYWSSSLPKTHKYVGYGRHGYGAYKTFKREKRRMQPRRRRRRW